MPWRIISEVMVDPKYVVGLEQPCVYFDQEFLPKDQARAYYEELRKSIHWETTSKINRWVSLHHTSSSSSSSIEELKEQDHYQYRDAPGAAHLGFPPILQEIQQAAEEWYLRETGVQVEFNVCLLNYYQNGQQRIGWHSDREEVGRSTPIASVSLGATRQLLLRNKIKGPQDRVALDMPNGSLIIMENICQHEYLHSVPKDPNVTEGRINLTFRCKTFTTAGEVMHQQRDQGGYLMTLTEGVLPDAQAWSSGTTTSNQQIMAKIFGDDVNVETLDQDFPKIRYLLKTNMGCERYCAAEVQEFLQRMNHGDDHGDSGDSLSKYWKVVARPLQMDGFVGCCSAESDDSLLSSIKEATIRALLNVKSAHHLMEYHLDFRLEDCLTHEKQQQEEIPSVKQVTGEMMYAYFKKRLVERTVVIDSMEQLVTDSPGSGTFRATCERVGGPHAFTRTEIEREMGGSLAEYFFEKGGIRPKMEDYDVCIRIEIAGNRAVVGTQLNVTDLSKDRHFLKFRNAVTLKTNIAYAMIRLANVQPGQTILDPFCGSGTLLLEALEMYNKQVFCIGLDVSKRCANGARENALAEQCDERHCRFECSDARGLRRFVQDESVDAIISNLPWGVQTGQHNSVKELCTLYEIFLRTSWYILKPGGRIVILVLRGLQLMRILRRLSGRYRLLNVNVIRTTNNLPTLLVVEKLASDEIRDTIKGQLAYLQQFVTVGPEIFEALHDEQLDEDDK